MVLFTIIGGDIVPVIEMSLSETIFDLKEKIREVLDVEVHRQSLWYCNKELRDHKFIEDYGCHRDATFILNVTPPLPHVKLHVLVKHTGSNGYVRVEETDMVGDLRRNVEKYWGIPPELFTLYRLNVEMMDMLIISMRLLRLSSVFQLNLVDLQVSPISNENSSVVFYINSYISI